MVCLINSNLVFEKGRSTMDTAETMGREVFSAFKFGQGYVWSMCYDLRKAFYSVNHVALISELYYYDTSVVQLQLLIKSY